MGFMESLLTERAARNLNDIVKPIPVLHLRLGVIGTGNLNLSAVDWPCVPLQV